MRRTLFVAVLAAVVGAVVATPIAVYASHSSFTDVPATNTFHDDIAWLAEAGVTKGCNPPANTEFCPKDEVTREQMAAFMHRLAENQVVDAASAIQAENATTADSATTAGDADTVDGMHASGLIQSTQLLYASVGHDGTLYAGNAVSAARTSTGSDEVTFDRSTSGCAGTAGSGFTTTNLPLFGSTGTTFNAHTGNLFGSDVETVLVGAWDAHQQTGEDSSFHLIVMCPANEQ